MLLDAGATARGLADEASVQPSVGAPCVCTHCGLTVPAGLIVPDTAEQFCCAGCRAAYALIHSCGLDSFYALRRAFGTEAVPADWGDRTFAEFDDPAFAASFCRASPEGRVSVELLLAGVQCAACVWLLERLPHVCDGVLRAELNLRRATLRLDFDPARVRLSRVARTLHSLGYTPHPARDGATDALRRAETRTWLVRLGVAGACAGNAMVLAFALYGGAFADMAPEWFRLFRGASMLVGLASIFGPGAVFFRSALAAVRTRSVNLDLPIALALLVGAVSGTVNVVLGRGEIYFDSLTMLVFFLLVGRFLQARQQRWAGDALELLFSLTPTSARVRRAGTSTTVAVESLAPGDLVEVLPGESVPVDGVICEGATTLDRSLLSGESAPVPAAVGDEVAAGSVNAQSPIVVRTSATGRRTRAGRLMDLVEASLRRRAPILRFTDRVGVAFTVAVPVAALCTLLLWLWLNPARAVDQAAAMLIVTCPCALGLAAPLVMTIAIGRGARRGTLIKGADVLEALSRPGTILLDKTGTLTRGRLSVVARCGDERAIALAAALERHASHPIARAIAACGVGATGVAGRAGNVVQTNGGGVRGTVDGESLVVGSARFLADGGCEVDALFATEAARQARLARTPVLVSVNGRAAALLAIGDALHDDAVAVVRSLRRRGWRIGLLSGDHRDVVAATARTLGLDPSLCHAGLSPEQKHAIVVREAARGTVVMVGDGVNDAAALAAATVGIAVRGGAEASLSAADVYLSRPGLAPLLELVNASAAAMRAVHATLWASLVYNLVAALLALTGTIHPIAAAVMMPLSSLTMLVIAGRWRTFAGAQVARAGPWPAAAEESPCR